MSLRRVARAGDGWIALLTPEQDLAASVARLRELCSAAGRDADAVPVEVLMPVAAGSPDEWAAQLERFAADGVTHVCLASGRKQGRSPREHLDRLLEARAALAP